MTKNTALMYDNGNGTRQVFAQMFDSNHNGREFAEVYEAACSWMLGIFSRAMKLMDKDVLELISDMKFKSAMELFNSKGLNKFKLVEMAESGVMYWDMPEKAAKSMLDNGKYNVVTKPAVASTPVSPPVTLPPVVVNGTNPVVNGNLCTNPTCMICNTQRQMKQRQVNAQTNPQVPVQPVIPPVPMPAGLNVKNSGEYSVDLESSVIKRAQWKNNVLTITMNNGGIYDYSNVPSKTFVSLVDAKSAGQYYNRYIKGMPSVKR